MPFQILSFSHLFDSFHCLISLAFLIWILNFLHRFYFIVFHRSSTRKNVSWKDFSLRYNLLQHWLIFNSTKKCNARWKGWNYSCVVGFTRVRLETVNSFQREFLWTIAPGMNWGKATLLGRAARFFYISQLRTSVIFQRSWSLCAFNFSRRNTDKF